MNRRLLLRSLLLRLTRQKGKSALMASVIALGVAATVLLVSLSGLALAKFRSFLEVAYPADGVVVMAGGGPMTRGGPRRLDLSDAEALAAALGTPDWDPLVGAGRLDVRLEGETAQVPVLGTSERAEWVRRRPVREGSYFTSGEVASRDKVALVGETVVARLFGGDSPVGATIHVSNVPFRVVGVLDRLGSDPHGGDQDDVVVIPYTTLLDTLLRSTSISAVTLRLDDRSRIGPASEEITALLRERHAIGPGQEDDFSVFTAARMNQLFERSFGTIQIFVPLIAGALFLVAALVVLTVQQLSVRSRWREIGLRRAVGARRRDVGVQIVLETIVVSVVACAAGLLLAVAGFAWLAPLANEKFGLAAIGPSIEAVVVAIAAALVVAVLGALLPARRAARLDPVVALR